MSEVDIQQSETALEGAEDAETRAEDLLVDQAKAGNKAAFEQLVAINYDRVRSLLGMLIADDQLADEVLQETFLRAWRALERFESRSRFYTWIHRIAVNEANRALAREGRRERNETQAPDDLADRSDIAAGPSDRAEQAELLASVSHALRKLPYEERVAIVLRDVEGDSTRHAAALIGVSEAAFKSRLHRARMRLRELLEESL